MNKNKPRIYPAYFKAQNAIIAVISATEAVAVFPKGSINILDNEKEISECFEKGAYSSYTAFYKQYLINSEFIYNQVRKIKK